MKKLRTIKEIHDAEYSPVGDLITYSPLPSDNVEMIDPFLLLNHHGPQTYGQNNGGMPFGPHPHRGMETVTFILEGDILHKDSHGHESVIKSGGVQWMTAGRGLIHAEVSSDEFKKKGGKLEILQLWINLASKDKMAEPVYEGFQKDEIPHVVSDGGKVRVNVISGLWAATKGVRTPLNPISLYTIEFKAGGSLRASVPLDENIFFYIVRGALKINGQDTEERQLLEFSNDEEGLQMAALTESYVIFGHARPFNEPVVAHGPFVMNTMDEIRQAYDDYKSGKFGKFR